MINAILDMAKLDERRRNMPLASQRRHDLYEVLDKMGPCEG